MRTSLALSALSGQPLRVENIRARRPKPGLQAQHLTGVLAMAQICHAEVKGAGLGSQTLIFTPRTLPQAGEYAFDVAEARKGGSAGSTSLVFQTALLPLALAGGESRLTIRGGTHVAWSPPFHYLKHVYLPTLARMGIEASVEIERWGWYPIGGGEIRAVIKGKIPDANIGDLASGIRSIDLTERGEIRRLYGFSASSNLPSHIAERQKRRAERFLKGHGFAPEIEIIDAPSPGQGTAVFLVAEFENVVAGFTAYGARGKRAEKVAEEACREFVDYYESEAALEDHLADQLILPLAWVGRGIFTTCRITQHLLTNVAVVEQFTEMSFEVEGREGERGTVRFQGRGLGVVP